MDQLLLVFHVLTALAIVGLILLQQGKGAEMGASFGAGASQTVFGSRGSGNALTRATAVLAAVFFVTSFGLTYYARERAALDDDLIEYVPEVIESREIAPPDEEVPAPRDDRRDREIPSVPVE